MTEILGHRGCRKRYADNSMAAYNEAFIQGCDGIELDARPTADGDIALFHDPKINGQFIHQLTRTQIAEIQPEILFAEQLDQLPEYLGTIQLELKPAPLPAWHEAFRHVEEFIDKRPNVVITSFDRELLRFINRHYPWMPRGLLVDTLDCNPTGLARGLGCKLIAVRRNSISGRLIKQAKKLGLEVSVWTVNDINRAKHYREMGVDQIITDRPWAFCPII